jgi:soluble lytic murein transglycosylase
MKKWWICFVLVWLTADAALARWWWLRRREHQAELYIREASRRYHVDPALIKAVVWKESGFRPWVRGRSGELGLMQVGSLAAGEWASAEKIPRFQREHLLHPGTNTMAGSWYLARLLRRYRHLDNPAAFALADYNAGRTHVLRWIRGNTVTNAAAFVTSIDFPSTRAYVGAVLARRDKYRRAYEPPSATPP